MHQSPEMTPENASGRTSVHKTDDAKRRLKKRYAFETRFKFFGIFAIALAATALFWLLSTVVGKSLGAFHETYITLPVELAAEKIDAKGNRDPKDIRAGNFSGAIKASLRQAFPYITKRRDKLKLYKMVSNGAELSLRERVMRDPSIIGTTQTVRLLASDDVDLYMKGYEGSLEARDVSGVATPLGTTGKVRIIVESNSFSSILARVKDELRDKAQRFRDQARREARGIRVFQRRIDTLPSDADPALRTDYEGRITAYENRRQSLIESAQALEKKANTPGGTEQVSSALPSFFLAINGGVVKITRVSPDAVEGQTLVPLSSDAPAADGSWQLLVNPQSEAGRRIRDAQTTWVEELRKAGAIDTTFNTRFFTAADSREAETAGIWSSAAGSFWTMLVTFFLSFPIGVAAAIYLEQFAPKNRITDFIEVNINNLAAVPSIVFGLLGLAVVIEFLGNDVFGRDLRSTALAGGIVLALMSLPTIIIASRAAIKAVPPSIKEAALGVGASNVQAVFHHVLPLAMPGILTGTIIAMAQALGETAPLLMIGMVAFITEVPGSPMDNASVLPVQIFRWSDFPERAFEMRTAAAILLLLGFLVIMNAIAVLLRKRFERRW
ncbi:MAG: phosphate ABC transporter permease PstA [Pseudomonadota bacterium]